MSVMDCLPIGYKRTPLGVIPQEWEVLPLSVAFRIQGGYAFKSELFSTTGDIPVIRISNLPQNSRFVELSDCVYYPSHIEICSQFTIHKGDLLIAMSGATTGKTAIFNKSFNAYLNQRVGVFRQTTNKILYSYLLSIIHSTLFKYKLQPLLIAGAQPNISSNDIEDMKFAIPPIQEQKKIAELLSEWDKAIELQTKLIEELELRKCALMQRLLTRRVRLNGFSDQWRKVKLGEFCERIVRKNLSNNKNVMTISAQKGFVPQTDFFSKTIASETLDNYYLVHKNEFCYNKSYSNGYPMGAVKRLKEVNEAVVTTLYICFKLKENADTNIDFFEQYCKFGGLNRELVKVANEGGRAHGLLNVTPNDFFNMKLAIPSLAEQTAISEVLVSADKEIEIAKAKLSSLRNQKRGLMQQLLTGKKRVK